MEENLADLVRALTGFGSEQMEEVGISGFVFVMAVSLACSLFIAYLYKYFYSRRSTGTQIHRAFPLLGIAVTSIFITIQFSLPLSLGLLGALSIVRFRTPIKEPEEIGFLMLLIAVSISCATFNIVFLGIVLFMAVIALFILRLGLLTDVTSDAMIVVTLEEDTGHRGAELLTHLRNHTNNGRVESISRNGNESIISYAFLGIKESTLAEFQIGLDKLLGHSHYDIFLNQQRIS